MAITKFTKNGIMIMCHQVIGTNHLIFEAWEKTKSVTAFSTIHFDDDCNCWGKIGTKDIPNEIKELHNGSMERILGCRNFREKQDHEIKKLILEAFGEQYPALKNVEVFSHDMEIKP